MNQRNDGATVSNPLYKVKRRMSIADYRHMQTSSRRNDIETSEDESSEDDGSYSPYSLAQKMLRKEERNAKRHASKVSNHDSRLTERAKRLEWELSNEKITSTGNLYYVPECASHGPDILSTNQTRTFENLVKNSPNHYKSDQKVWRNNYYWLILVVLVVVIAIAIAQVISSEPPHTFSEEELRHSYDQHMSSIKHHFPSQIEDIWTEFFVGIKKVILERPTNPSIFLLIHHENEITSTCLASKVGEVARSVMNVTKSTRLILDGGELGKTEHQHMSDGYWLVVEYKPQVEAHHIMIMNNLQMLPTTFAKSLHAFCDTDTPLVDKAIYIFTLNVPGGWKAKESSTAIAERELNRVWNRLEEDIRSPLIVRVTGGTVLKVKEESGKLPC